MKKNFNTKKYIKKIIKKNKRVKFSYLNFAHKLLIVGLHYRLL